MHKGLRGFVYFLAGLNLLNFIDNYILSSVGAYLQRDLGLTDAQLGLIGAAFVWGFLAVSPFVGWLNRKINTAALIGASVLVWSLALGAIGVVGNVVMILWMRFIGGAGQGVFYTLAPVMINEHVMVKHRNQAFSIFYAALPLGTALGFLIGGLLALTFGWQLAFMFAGALGIPLAVAAYSIRKLRIKSNEKSHYIHEVVDLLSSKKYLLLVIGSAAQAFAIAGFAFWAPIYLLREFDLSPALGSVLFGGLLIVTGIIGALGGGWVAGKIQNKYGLKSLISWSFILICFGAMAAFAVVLANSVWLFFVAIGIVEIAIFASFAPYTTIFFASIPQVERATGSGIANMFSRMFGDMLGIWLIGFLSVALGDLSQAIYVLPFALIINAVAWAWCRKFISPSQNLRALARG